MKLEQQQQEVIDMLTQLFDEARRQYYELAQKVAKGDQVEVDRMMAEYEQNFELIRNPPTHKDQLGHLWQQCWSGAWRLWNGAIWKRAEPKAGSQLVCLKTQQSIIID